MMQRLKVQARDQLAHFATVLFGLLPFALFPCVLSGMWAGFVMGMVREVAEAGNPVTWGKIKGAVVRSDAPLDLTFWTLGGAVVGALV